MEKYKKKLSKHPFYTPSHDSGGVLCFHVGRPGVISSVPDDNLNKHQRILTKLRMCIDGLGLISSISDSYLPTTRPHVRFRTIT